MFWVIYWTVILTIYCYNDYLPNTSDILEMHNSVIYLILKYSLQMTHYIPKMRMNNNKIKTGLFNKHGHVNSH